MHGSIDLWRHVHRLYFYANAYRMTGKHSNTSIFQQRMKVGCGIASWTDCIPQCAPSRVLIVQALDEAHDFFWQSCMSAKTSRSVWVLRGFTVPIDSLCSDPSRPWPLVKSCAYDMQAHATSPAVLAGAPAVEWLARGVECAVTTHQCGLDRILAWLRCTHDQCDVSKWHQEHKTVPMEIVLEEVDAFWSNKLHGVRGLWGAKSVNGWGCVRCGGSCACDVRGGAFCKLDCIRSFEGWSMLHCSLLGSPADASRMVMPCVFFPSAPSN